MHNRQVQWSHFKIAPQREVSMVEWAHDHLRGIELDQLKKNVLSDLLFDSGTCSSIRFRKSCGSIGLKYDR
jgi:hypothetical protein